MRDATSLGPVLRVLVELQQVGIKLAVVSDGDEELARAQFRKLGWSEELFELVVGANSGARAGGRVACPPGSARRGWRCGRWLVVGAS